jgi:GNAT superfamily N-acetyltransferase
VGRYPFQLRLATPGDLSQIVALINEASAWLGRAKGTDQWQRPWPDRAARDARVRAGVVRGETWIAWDGHTPMGTITITAQANPVVWSNLSPDCDLTEDAIYAHRLILARKYAGLGLGAELIDWAGLYGQRVFDARWLRVDVWRSNYELHEYYRGRGFLPCGSCADPGYPSGALFQKPVIDIAEPTFPRFAETVREPMRAHATPWSSRLGSVNVLCADGY